MARAWTGISAGQPARDAAVRVRVYADTRLLGLALWRNRVLAPLRLVAIESGAEPVPDPAA